MLTEADRFSHVILDEESWRQCDDLCQLILAKANGPGETDVNFFVPLSGCRYCEFCFSIWSFQVQWLYNIVDQYCIHHRQLFAYF